MEFRTCFCCIIINCAVLLPYITAKSVSLNKLIAEEKSLQSRQRDFIKPETERKSTKELLGAKLNTFSRKGSLFSQDKIISPLQYRKTFQIKSPLKPRRINLFQRPRNKLKNQTTKRETYQYGTLNQKYIPLLRNLGLLFDNILGPDSSKQIYSTGEYRDSTYSDESDEVICTCASKKGTIARAYETRQKTAASSRSVATEIPTKPAEATTTTTANPTTDNIGSVGWHKDVPLLLARNTTSFRRNNNRLDERSSTSHLGSTERYIARDCGDHECDSRNGEIEPDTKDNEENPRSIKRDNASSDGPNVGGNRNNTRGPDRIGETVSEQFTLSSSETAQGFRGHIPQHEREIQFEIRGDEAQSASVLSKSNSGLREFESGEETELLQIQNYEENTTIEPYSDSIVRQFPERNGENTFEDQKLRGANEAVTSNLALNVSSPDEKYVMIFDGYSVARDVNGKNTLTEKAITIHS